MCIIVTDDMKPASTKLVTVRLQEFTPECRAYLTLYQNTATTRNYKLKRKQLMIVPFPHACKQVTDEHLMLVEFSTAETEDRIFTELQRNYPVPISDRNTAANNSEKIPVTQLGGYKVSLVPNYEALVERVDWNAFSLTGNFSLIMDDMKARFNKGYGYVVAEPAINPVDERVGGTFGWVWYGDRAMLPTAHEKSKVDPMYDVDAWVLNDYVKDMRWSDEAKTKFGSGDDSHVMKWREHKLQSNSTLQALLDTARMFQPGKPKESKPLELPDIYHAVSVRLHGSHPINHHLETVPGVTPDPTPKSILKMSPQKNVAPAKPQTWLHILLGLLLAALVVWFLYTFVWKPQQEQDN